MNAIVSGLSLAMVVVPTRAAAGTSNIGARLYLSNRTSRPHGIVPAHVITNAQLGGMDVVKLMAACALEDGGVPRALAKARRD